MSISQTDVCQSNVPNKTGPVFLLANANSICPIYSLADLAEFYVFARKTYKLTDANKWIAYGGSYPGSLAAWFRIKVRVTHNSSSLLARLMKHQAFAIKA